MNRIKYKQWRDGAAFCLLGVASCMAGSVAAQTANPAHWQQALTPPLGWNSWDIFGTTVTEAQIQAQADAMQAELLPAGYDILTVDIQWYEPNSVGHVYNPDAVLTMDEYGRLTPGLTKFPSAANGQGFKPLADYVHSKGLRFGIHIMRGIPRQAVEQNLPVLGTSVGAADIALTDSISSWNPDMYGVDASLPEGQAYYDSIFALYASWGVDFVKVDDISRPYDAVQQAEIEAVRAAIDASGRPMVLSLSPGATPLEAGPHVVQHANMWRITDDFWDTWPQLFAMFERLDAWTPYRYPGAWPDADMLPLGIVEFGRPTNFTEDEQYTLMSLWSIGRSPLIFGGDMTALDSLTIDLLTNSEVLQVNQASTNNHQVSRDQNLVTWAADAQDSGDKFVGLFNAQDMKDAIPYGSPDYLSPVIAEVGATQEISVDIGGGGQLVLFVTTGGDNFNYDHVAWVEPTLHGPAGDLALTDLEWAYADSGWGQPMVDLTDEGETLLVNGVQVSGIGTHADSTIVYDIPAGYTSFSATGALTQAGSVEFGVYVHDGAPALSVDNAPYDSPDYLSPVLSGEGAAQAIEVALGDANQLLLFVTTGGDNFNYDHVAWVEPTLHGPQGDLPLTELQWRYADSGWGAPMVDLTDEGQPLLVDGGLVSGIGTHADSTIIYDIPAGYTSFTTTGALTQNGSVEFGVITHRADPITNDAATTANVGLELAAVGIGGKALARDLWSHQGLGLVEDTFSRDLRRHGSGLYKLAPIDCASADYQSPVLAGAGSSVAVEVALGNASQLALHVTTGGDNFNYDHVAWVEPTLHGPQGDLSLTELSWQYADSGWGAPMVNLTDEGEPLVVAGQVVTGLGTHAESTIVYDIPEGYTSFTAEGALTQQGSVEFCVIVN